MSVHLVRELFRNLETTLHERQAIIEDIIQKSVGGNGSMEQSMQIQRPDPAVLDRLSKVENTVKHVLDSVLSVEATMRAYRQDMETLRARMLVLEAAQKTVAPAPEEVQQEIAKREVAAAPELAEAEAAEVDEEEEEVVEEEVVEEEEVEEEVVEEEEEVEEEEGEELVLESFVYKRNGKTYYRDTDNNVYQEDEDGNVIDTPIGVWNDKTERIHPLSK